MSEWWTYSLRDFLLFSPRTYYRLIEAYNANLWPAHIVALPAGLVLAAAAWRGARIARRIAGGILAVAWAWVAWGFLWQRYTSINWSATYMAVAFAVEAVLLAFVGVRLNGKAASRRERFPESTAVRITFGWLAGSLLLGVALAYPALALLAGRGLQAAEVFGLAPDPTVIATLGAFALRPGLRWWLLPIPLAWCAVSGATLWAMRSPEALLLPVAALLALAAAAVQVPERTSRPA